MPVNTDGDAFPDDDPDGDGGLIADDDDASGIVIAFVVVTIIVVFIGTGIDIGIDFGITNTDLVTAHHDQISYSTFPSEKVSENYLKKILLQIPFTIICGTYQ